MQEWRKPIYNPAKYRRVSDQASTHNMLVSFREVCPKARFYFAGSCEMFGKATKVPRNEDTPSHPRPAYGVSKRRGFHLPRNYREAYNLFSVTGIFCNHESPRCGFEFVARKISYHVGLISLGSARKLKLGNLEAMRDWGHARRYIDAMWKMLRLDLPENFVVATGETHNVRERCQIAFSLVGLDYRDYVEVDPAPYRPSEVELLAGDSSKARTKLKWRYNIPFEELVKEMVESDLKRLRVTSEEILFPDPYGGTR